METTIDNVSDDRKEKQDIALELQTYSLLNVERLALGTLPTWMEEGDMTAPDRITSDRQTIHSTSPAFFVRLLSVGINPLDRCTDNHSPEHENGGSVVYPSNRWAKIVCTLHSRSIESGTS